MEKPKYVYDEEYEGSRWTYGLMHRPLQYSNVPDGWIIFSERQHADFAFGTVDYPFELDARTISSYQLTVVVKEDESE